MSLDVSVKRGAECNTDHRLLCTRIKLSKGMYKRRDAIGRGNQYDVTSLIGIHGSENSNERHGSENTKERQRSENTKESHGSENSKERYVGQVLERAADSWPEEGSLEEQWMAVRSALVETADEQLG